MGVTPRSFVAGAPAVALGNTLFLAASCWAVSSAQAKPATCFTTDEGRFRCEFRVTAPDGSFEISARGKPTYALIVTEPGVADAFMNLGTRNIPLPGRYLRKGEPGCWESDATRNKICARE